VEAAAGVGRLWDGAFSAGENQTTTARACSHAGIVSGDNEKVPIQCRYFFTVRLGLRVSNYRHPLTPCAARKKLNLFASQRD
jgi:hypothetical protein